MFIIMPLYRNEIINNIIIHAAYMLVAHTNIINCTYQSLKLKFSLITHYITCKIVPYIAFYLNNESIIIIIIIIKHISHCYDNKLKKGLRNHPACNQQEPGLQLANVFTN